LKASQIRSEADLAEILARCGFASDAPQQAPSRDFWKNEWRSRELRLSRYLTDFPNDEFFVVVDKDVFEVYVQDRQDFWFHKIGEIQGDTSEQELCAMIRRAISGEASE
jgi:hypothetical protein